VLRETFRFMLFGDLFPWVDDPKAGGINPANEKHREVSRSCGLAGQPMHEGLMPLPLSLLLLLLPLTLRTCPVHADCHESGDHPP